MYRVDFIQIIYKTAQSFRQRVPFSYERLSEVLCSFILPFGVLNQWPIRRVAFLIENINILAILKENKGSFLLTIQKQHGSFGLHLFTGFG